MDNNVSSLGNLAGYTLRTKTKHANFIRPDDYAECFPVIATLHCSSKNLPATIGVCIPINAASSKTSIISSLVAP